MENNCTVCFEPCFHDHAASGDLTYTHCKHMFHSKCLSNWNISGHPSACNCPVCRTELIANFVDQDNVTEANILIPEGSSEIQAADIIDLIARISPA